MKVVSAMAMVRNSVGQDCYVADEIITSRAGDTDQYHVNDDNVSQV